MESGSTLESVTGEQLTDEEVVSRVKAGDTALYEIIMRRYNQRLYRVAGGNGSINWTTKMKPWGAP